MLNFSAKLSFCDRYDSNLNYYCPHAKQRLRERKIIPADVERIVSDPAHVNLHLPQDKKVLHIGRSSHEDMFLIVSTVGRNVITEFEKSIQKLKNYIETHYPENSHELFEKLTHMKKVKT